MIVKVDGLFNGIPSGKHTKNYGTSPFFMGNIKYFNGHFQWQTVSLPEGISFNW